MVIFLDQLLLCLCIRESVCMCVCPCEIKGEFLIYKSLKMWKFSCYLTSSVV